MAWASAAEKNRPMNGRSICRFATGQTSSQPSWATNNAFPKGICLSRAALAMLGKLQDSHLCQDSFAPHISQAAEPGWRWHLQPGLGTNDGGTAAADQPSFRCQHGGGACFSSRFWLPKHPHQMHFIHMHSVYLACIRQCVPASGRSCMPVLQQACPCMRTNQNDNLKDSLCRVCLSAIGVAAAQLSQLEGGPPLQLTTG